MRVLLFQNNVHSTEPVEFPDGVKRAVNLTVRKGLKWSNLHVGDKVELRETGAEVSEAGARVYATIYDVKVMTLNDLSNYAKMLKLEHDPDCQTFSGLYKEMRRVYDGFLSHELVTLVFYELP